LNGFPREENYGGQDQVYLQSDLNLLKRPVIINGKKKLTGFNETDLKTLL